MILTLFKKVVRDKPKSCAKISNSLSRSCVNILRGIGYKILRREIYSLDFSPRRIALGRRFCNLPP